MSDELDRFLQDVENLNRAAIKLVWSWDKLKGPERDLTDGGEYPFHESFDEMSIRIDDWYHDLKDKIEEFKIRSGPKIHYFVVAGYKNKANETKFYLDHDMQEVCLANHIYNPATEKMQGIDQDILDDVSVDDMQIMSKLCEKLEVYRDGE